LSKTEIPALVLAATGAIALLVLVARWRQGRPLLASTGPLPAARPGPLLILSGAMFLGQRLGTLLLLHGNTAGRAMGLGLPLLLAVLLVREARRQVLRPRGSVPWRVGMGLLHTWAALPLVYGTFLLGRWLGLAEQPQVVSLRDRTEGWQALMLAAGILAPVAEEICFRGLLYPALRQGLGVRHATLFTSLSFALVHPPGVWVPMAIFSVFLCWLVETTGSVVPCIAGHAAFNAVNLAQLLLLRG
jgi:membrane protease YdiL (CAAX protease family)